MSFKLTQKQLNSIKIKKDKFKYSKSVNFCKKLKYYKISKSKNLCMYVKTYILYTLKENSKCTKLKFLTTKFITRCQSKCFYKQNFLQKKLTNNLQNRLNS